jgi:hypothetical protein
VKSRAGFGNPALTPSPAIGNTSLLFVLALYIRDFYFNKMNFYTPNNPQIYFCIMHFAYFSIIFDGLTGITAEYLIPVLLFLENLKIK